MSARRINAPGKPPVLIPLGHDEPIRHTDKLIELMRMPMDERMGGKPRGER